MKIHIWNYISWCAGRFTSLNFCYFSLIIIKYKVRLLTIFMGNMANIFFLIKFVNKSYFLFICYLHGSLLIQTQLATHTNAKHASNGNTASTRTDNQTTMKLNNCWLAIMRNIYAQASLCLSNMNNTHTHTQTVTSSVSTNKYTAIWFVWFESEWFAF